jgi:hypothetical protein
MEMFQAKGHHSIGHQLLPGPFAYFQNCHQFFALASSSAAFAGLHHRPFTNRCRLFGGPVLT